MTRGAARDSSGDAGGASRAGSAREVFAVMLRLGLTSFGGPVAHLGYQHRAFVAQRRWLDEDAFAELVALCQVLPGPGSSQLTLAVGRLRAGWTGALAAFLGFTLPSAVFMAAIGIWVTLAQPPDAGPVAGAIAGLKVAAVAVVAHAVLMMARRLTPDAPRLAMALAAAVIALAFPTPFTQLALIAGAGALGWALLPVRAGELVPSSAAVDAGTAGGRGTAMVLLAAFLVVVLGSQLLAVVLGTPDAGLLAALVRAGALVFGGGHVVLPLLDAGVVQPGWVTEDRFLAGYGFAQALPGPLFTFAAYLGAVSTAGPGGIAGATIGTVAIFLPGVLLVLGALPLVGVLRERPRLRPGLDGVNAGVVGILAAALVSPVGTGGITSPLAGVLALAGAALLVTGRVAPIAVVAASAAVMALAAA